MGNIADRIVLAFANVFGDAVGGDFGDITFSDFGIVVVVIAVPLLTIMTIMGNPRS